MQAEQTRAVPKSASALGYMSLQAVMQAESVGMQAVLQSK